MANKDDYLVEYREFFENFEKSVNPGDQLPVKLAGYKLINTEVVGEIIEWTIQYLSQKKCPQTLLAPLVKIVVEETRKTCKKQPTLCGFDPEENVYEPLKLMQTVMNHINEICLRYLDNSKLCSLPTPVPPLYKVSVCAVKNTRRKMEDRHVVIHDLNSIFNVQDTSPSSYFAIFDGHAGHEAAAYGASHLHQFLAENPNFQNDPKEALKEAFLKTDALFINKCYIEKFCSGTTAVCALFRPKEKMLYVAWVGDSQALLVRQNEGLQCVHPHKPCREDEKNRIEKEGGTVLYWGTWRVNGQLAVSRAIGDLDYKPYVTAIPDIKELQLTGKEDFLIIACDGLWDHVSEDDAAYAVYDLLCSGKQDLEYISQRLVQLAKEKGSSDNITVIVVFLRSLTKIAAEAQRATVKGASNEMDATLNNNPFATITNGSRDKNTNEEHNLLAKNPFALDMQETNGKRHVGDALDVVMGDLGPESNVDDVDDALSPSCNISTINNNNNYNNPKMVFNDNFMDDFMKMDKVKEEDLSETVLNKDEDFQLIKKKNPRDETPTPPAETVLVQETISGGAVDNVGDSGEESEDEWNYFKGDSAEKKESQSQQELQESDCDMFQLNPNAAEFVPVSPSRDAPSPQLQRLINDPIISQSPRKSSQCDNFEINVPNEEEFETEIKSRPSDLMTTNGGETVDEEAAETTTTSTQEVLQKVLNGKNIEEMEFQPGDSSPVKSNEHFLFGSNSTPFTQSGSAFLDRSEAFSTKANFGDETLASYMEDKDLDKEIDIDELNKVHVLPDKIDDFSQGDLIIDSFSGVYNCKAPVVTDLDSSLDLETQTRNEGKGDHVDVITFETNDVQVHRTDDANHIPVCELKTATIEMENLLEINSEQTEGMKADSECSIKQQSVDDLIQNLECSLEQAKNIDEELKCTMEQAENNKEELSCFVEQTEKIVGVVEQSENTKENVKSLVELSESIQATSNSSTEQQENVKVEEIICGLNPIIIDCENVVEEEIICQLMPEPESVIKEDASTIVVKIKENEDVIEEIEVKPLEENVPVAELEVISPEPKMVTPETASPRPELSRIPEQEIVVEELPDYKEDEEQVTSSIKDDDFVSSPEEEIKQQLDLNESITTTDVNSFLNRSTLSDVASPLTSPDTLQNVVVVEEQQQTEKQEKSKQKDVVKKTLAAASKRTTPQKPTSSQKTTTTASLKTTTTASHKTATATTTTAKNVGLVNRTAPASLAKVPGVVGVKKSPASKPLSTSIDKKQQSVVANGVHEKKSVSSTSSARTTTRNVLGARPPTAGGVSNKPSTINKPKTAAATRTVASKPAPLTATRSAALSTVTQTRTTTGSASAVTARSTATKTITSSTTVSRSTTTSTSSTTKTATKLRPAATTTITSTSSSRSNSSPRPLARGTTHKDNEKSIKEATNKKITAAATRKPTTTTITANSLLRKNELKSNIQPKTKTTAIKSSTAVGKKEMENVVNQTTKKIIKIQEKQTINVIKDLSPLINENNKNQQQQQQQQANN